ncbi:MAG: GAF domain-containing sensor histidine kinase [Myxococcaceae bacterium]|nr:GAF domain-containing sensor histidine kinase [Myxococcaceae bacterium]
MTDRIALRNGGAQSPSGLVTGLAEKLEELEHAVGRQAERFSAVLDIGTQISAARDVDQLLGLVMDRLTALLGCEASTLFMIDEEHNELWSRVLRGSSLKEIRLPVNAGIAGHVVSTGKTLLLADAYSDIHFNPEIDRKSGFRTRSMIAAPLRHVSGRILGVVEVLDRKVNAFSQEDRALVEGVASQIAAVIDNVVLLEKLKSQNEKLTVATGALQQAVQDLDVLYEIERAISASDEQTDLLDRILVKAMSVIGAEAGSILLMEKDRDALYFKTAKGEKAESLISMKLSTGQGIAGHVAVTGESVRVNVAEESPHYERGVAKKLGVHVGSVLCVPILGENEVIGALELLNKKTGFTEADERLGYLLAGQTGRALVLRQSRDEVERKARLAAIGQMLSGVLHDVRTPMMVIGGYAELMVDDEDRASRQDAAALILSQLEHLNAMTRETLAFAKGESDLLLRKVYLQNFVKDVSAQLEIEFEKTKVELKVQAEYLGLARFDENKVKRVVYNMARNAIDAMPKGGKFVFAVEREAEDLVMRFQDNGPGIPAEIADKLFQSFVTAGKKNGTGLGLAIAKKIAVEHGGSIECKSKPGKGTTFEMRFPAGMPHE